MRQLLDINTVPMKLEYSTTKGQYNMSQPKASLDIEINRPELRTQPHPIKLKTDRREMYASMGIYMPDQFRRKTEQDAKQDVMDFIGETGDDARVMAETKGRALVDICQRKCGYQPVDLETAYIPSVKPEMIWEGGEKTDTYFTPFKMDIKWNVHVTPDIEYTRGKINLSVSQWNKVNISYVGTYDDISVVGKKFNFKM
ncbi:MAG: DUF6470 family protein [Oscillospiraceae bacterium]|nr:DUF6470 family protein [Oscillospiraceae bacterium]